MPFMRSESCSFIWHPKVVTWYRRTATENLAGRQNLEAGYAAELARVTCRQRQPVADSCRGDPEVVRTDHLAAPGELCPDIGMHTGDRLGDRDRLQAGEQMLDERTAPRTARPRRTMYAVQQLADGHDAD